MRAFAAVDAWRRGCPHPRFATALVLTFVLLGCARNRPETPAVPVARDVILITIDTMRADAAGFAGNAQVKTPFLDSIASRGIVFSNAHAHNVVTLPSHVNMLTGLNPYQHGVRENAGFTLDRKHVSVASMLRSAGFATGAFVSAFPLDARFGLDQGFDMYDDNYGKGDASADFVVQERAAQPTLDAATRWWQANEGRKRFLWVHLYDPHAPYTPPEPFASEYRTNRYLGEIAYVDSVLRSSLAPLLAANPETLLIVTSDHGEALGDHGEKTHGLFAYEATLKVPLLVAGPGIAHRTEAGHVRHIDIVPTILSATGTRAPNAIAGASLFEPIGVRDTYFESLSASLNRGWAPLTGVIHRATKYIDLPVAELYDLQRDPAESNNLRDERRRDIERARTLLTSMSAVQEKTSRSVSAEEMARLRALGYVSGSAAPRASYTAEDDPKTLITLDDKMHDAVDAFQRRETEHALTLARQVVASRPDMAAGRELLAFMLQQNDRVPEAVEQLKIVVGNPTATDDQRTQLALLYSELGNTQAAIALLAPRVPSTRDPDVLNAYGVALADDGRLDEAHAQFERVLAVDRNNAPAVQNLGILALRRGNINQAKAYLLRALDLNPRLPLALNTLGVVFARSEDFANAVGAWNRAVAIDPRQYDALFNIGMVAGRAGHREEARRALSRFVQTAPKASYAQDIATAQRALRELESGVRRP